MLAQRAITNCHISGHCCALSANCFRSRYLASPRARGDSDRCWSTPSPSPPPPPPRPQCRRPASNSHTRGTSGAACRQRHRGGSRCLRRATNSNTRRNRARQRARRARLRKAMPARRMTQRRSSMLWPRVLNPPPLGLAQHAESMWT